ncbi:glycosyltransferase, group 2 family protein [Prevotella sp. DNF00663]|uniref:glycosyltransferase family A protein n=1 Tax=Prevotella sp. DNF00663 TaxID=1384078 RepID=UPI0007818B2B|nr:glycosyltransferase family A protein [Prevotella sp. DNF00663]KXB84906.1 glycosyltransferase, group 2 family protein [Prevotella sp. DNF00663]
MIITIFTPTYNRGALLERLYDSLCQQDYHNLEWLIVDDGSTDNTETVISNIKDKGRPPFPIRYYRKENGGKHTAINLGVKEAKGELFFIADSDDFLAHDALLLLEEQWKKIEWNKNFAGLCGLDTYVNRDRIGSGLPMETIACNTMDIRYRHHVTGDLKEVFRTDILRKYPFPEIEREVFCPEQLVWFRIGQKYKLYYFNKVIYCVEYQVDGITATIVKARMNSPVCSMMTYQEMTEYDIPFVQKIKAAINYWRFRFCLTQSELTYPKLKYYWNLMMPIGWLMHLRDLQLIKK